MRPWPPGPATAPCSAATSSWRGAAGYWTAWSQGGQARLEHFADGPSDSTVETGADTSHPRLVAYGADHMLLAWESGDAIAAQVYDSGSGAAVGDTLWRGIMTTRRSKRMKTAAPPTPLRVKAIRRSRSPG